MVPFDRVIQEGLDCFPVLFQCSELKRTDTYMRAGNPGQDCSRQGGFTIYLLSVSHYCKAARGRDIECLHCFADDIFT